MKYKYSQYISLGYDSRGYRIRKHIYANSKNELALKKAQLQEQYRNTSVPLDISFKDYSERWLSAFKSNREAATRTMYRNALNSADGIRNMPMRDIRTIDVQEIINNKSDYPRLCQQIKLCLKQVWDSAINDGIITRNIVKPVSIPKYSAKEGRALKPEEKAVIPKCNLDPMDKIYVLTLFYLGVRPGEALGLMPADFDFKEKTVTISRAVGFDGNDPYVKPTKTSKVRTIPLPNEFIPTVKEYLSDLKSLYLFNRNGSLLTKTIKTDMWLRIRKEINIQLGGKSNLDLTDGLHPYTFRHNYCCTCYYSGISPLMTSKLMGNSVTMVMKVYSHIDESKERLDSLRELCI